MNGMSSYYLFDTLGKGNNINIEQKQISGHVSNEWDLTQQAWAKEEQWQKSKIVSELQQ